MDIDGPETLHAADDPPDAALVVASTRGDSEAFGRLVARHEQAARRLAAALVGPSDADDVAQEAFVRAFRSLATFRPGSDFRPWLLRIVANQAGNHRRGARRRERRERRDAIAGRDRQATADEPGDVAEQSDERRRLVSAMSLLPHKDRQVLVIRYLLGYSEEETAGVLGCARGTVKSRTSRALEKLRAHTDVAGLGERT